jgi:hypothetical protein
MNDARYVKELRWINDKKGFKLPRVFLVSLSGGISDGIADDEPGLVGVGEWFIVHDVEADEPVNGVAMTRFTLLRWSGEVRNYSPA